MTGHFLTRKHMIYGIDALCAARYTDTAVNNIPKDLPVKVFYKLDGIGRGLPVLRSRLKLGNPYCVGMHGVWSDFHTFTPTSLAQAIAGCKEFNELASEFKHTKNTKFFYSPYCEHNEGAVDMMAVMEHLQPFANNLTLVNCPSPKGSLLPGFYNEVHYSFNITRLRKPFLFSMDGASSLNHDNIKNIHLQLKDLGCEVFWDWDCSCNGKANDQEVSKRKDRTHWLTPRRIEQIIATQR